MFPCLRFYEDVKYILRSSLFTLHSSFLWQSSSLAQCLGYNPLKLPVGGAELVSRPSLNSIHHIRVYAQYKTLISRFLFCHDIILELKGFRMAVEPLRVAAAINNCNLLNIQTDIFACCHYMQRPYSFPTIYNSTPFTN